MNPKMNFFITLFVVLLFALPACMNLPPSPLPNTPTPIVIPTKTLVVHIPDKALLKNYVEVSVEAPAGTSCDLLYITPSGKDQKTTTTANSGGLCVWKWQLQESDGKGKGRLIFMVNGVSETHFLEIRSAF
jgi:hypothetical protein